MDPFTIALATFGVQKLRGKSTSRSLRDAALAAGIGYGIGQLGGAGLGIGQGSAFSSLGFGAQTAAEIGATGAGTGAGTAATTGGIPSLTAGTGGEFAGASLLEPVSVANPGSFLTNYNAVPTFSGVEFSGVEPMTSTIVDQNAANLLPTKQKSFFDSLIGSSPVAGQEYKPEIVVDGVVKQPEIPYIAADKGSGFLGLGTGAKLGIGVGALSALPLLMPEEEEKPLPGTTPEERAAAQAQATAQLDNFTSKRGAMPTYSGSPYNYGSNYYRFNTGGIVSALPKFSVGGVNYLPSKQTHDENDVYNYVRAAGYVEDGSGNGNKDEDTILAQLADGEFVSRADAILGAGIMEGASPSSMKDMRKKGAAFFYDQQAKFKRVYDLLDASRKDN
jgi:hypothetical protein